MRTTATASLLLALALAGTALSAPSLGPDEPPASARGGAVGTAIGCDLSGDHPYGYGEPGVPESNGYGDGVCDTIAFAAHGPVLYTVLKASGGWSYAGAYGRDLETWDYATLYVECLNEGATLLVDWTSETATYLEGEGCRIAVDGTVNIAQVEWYAFGGAQANVKYAHTNNPVDALLQLLD